MTFDEWYAAVQHPSDTRDAVNLAERAWEAALVYGKDKRIAKLEKDSRALHDLLQHLLPEGGMLPLFVRPSE